MKLYGYTEMLRDLAYVITGDKNSAAPDFIELFPGIENCRFHRLFSELYPPENGNQRLVGGESVVEVFGTPFDALPVKILEYLTNVQNVVPELDVEPDPGYELNVYSMDFKATEVSAEVYFASKLKFLSKVNVNDQPLSLKAAQGNPFVAVLIADKRETTFWSIKTND